MSSEEALVILSGSISPFGVRVTVAAGDNSIFRSESGTFLWKSRSIFLAGGTGAPNERSAKDRTATAAPTVRFMAGLRSDAEGRKHSRERARTRRLKPASVCRAHPVPEKPVSHDQRFPTRSPRSESSP